MERFRAVSGAVQIQLPTTCDKQEKISFTSFPQKTQKSFVIMNNWVLNPLTSLTSKLLFHGIHVSWILNMLQKKRENEGLQWKKVLLLSHKEAKGFTDIYFLETETKEISLVCPDSAWGLAEER